MSLYDKYLSRAELAFARRDAQRCPPDPEARCMLDLLTVRLSRLRANAADVLSLPYLLPSDRRDAEDGRG